MRAVNEAMHDNNYPNLIIFSHDKFVVDVKVDISFSTRDHCNITIVYVHACVCMHASLCMYTYVYVYILYIQ